MKEMHTQNILNYVSNIFKQSCTMAIIILCQCADKRTMLDKKCKFNRYSSFKLKKQPPQHFAYIFDYIRIQNDIKHTFM